MIVDTVRSMLGIVEETDNSGVARQVNPWVALAQARGVALVASTVSWAARRRTGASTHPVMADEAVSLVVGLATNGG